MDISIDTNPANKKLDAGLNKMLDMIIGMVNTNKLRPDANSSGESVSENNTSKKRKNIPEESQPGTAGFLFKL
jgi:hypothetical protein